MRARVGIAILLGLLAQMRMAGAQVTTVAEPTYHGILSIRRASGPVDSDSGSGTLHVPRWTLLVSPDSNGIFPGQEPLVIAMGEESFTLPAGIKPKASRSGKVFSYRAAHGEAPRGLQDFRLWLRPNGSYGIRFTLAEVELSRLKFEDGFCVPLAIIIGDDDFFNGILVTSRGPLFEPRRVVIAGSCDVGGDWPWIR